MRCAAWSILIASALTLGACANRPDNWYRAASTSEQANSDEHNCRQEASDLARQRSRRDANILQDRMAGDYGGASITRSDLNVRGTDRLAYDERENIRDLTRSCMADRGYRLMHTD